VCSECWDYQEACYGLPDSEEELERWQAEGTPPEDDPINQPEDFKNLRPSEQHALLDWIEDNLAPGKKASESSYSLKHYFERATGIYITNGQFKGAMQMAGYEPLDRDALN